jgi:hypothetical protein
VRHQCHPFEDRAQAGERQDTGEERPVERRRTEVEEAMEGRKRSQ